MGDKKMDIIVFKKSFPNIIIFCTQICIFCTDI